MPTDNTLPVVEAHVRYRRPARYDELLVVEPKIDQVRGASLRFTYAVTRDGTIVADGWTVHVCLGRDGRPVSLSAELKALAV